MKRTTRWPRPVFSIVLAAVAAVLSSCSTGGGSRPGAAGGSAAGVAPSSPGPAKVAAVGVTAPEQTTLGLAYAGIGERQMLDLVLPARTGRPVPLVIVVHGGAFLQGDKVDEQGTVQALVRRGYAAAAVNYRYSSQATFPAAVADVKAAVRFLRAQAADYGIDPGRFGIWGSSAGGYLAAMVGATTGQQTVFDTLDNEGYPGHTGVSSDVQAVVDWFGPINFLTMDEQIRTLGGCPGNAELHDPASSPESLLLGAPVQTVPELAARASPISYLKSSAGLPPFLVAHGRADCHVPYGQSAEFAEALKAAGARVTLTLLDGIGHGGGDFVASQETPALDFLDGVLHP